MPDAVHLVATKLSSGRVGQLAAITRVVLQTPGLVFVGAVTP